MAYRKTYATRARRSYGAKRVRRTPSARRYSSGSRNNTIRLVVQSVPTQPAVTGADLAAGNVRVSNPSRTRSVF